MHQANAIRILRDEHLAIASVLYSLRSLVRQVREGQRPADFRLLHAIIDYVVVFPERLHHPKEDRFLFSVVRERCPEAAPLLDELAAEHVRGGRLIEDLKSTLTAYARDGAAGFAAFASAVEDYARFHWQHMTKEEDRLLPLAQAHLLDDDWALIAEAFRSNDNPLFGIRPREQAELLYQKILSLTPADQACA